MNLETAEGSLFIRGRRVPIAGSICMDMCMVDVTGLNVRTGDEAEFLATTSPLKR
ncbi:MAG: hypothetical protein MZV63_41195 [Marinilabiliales bacterium]|nr:hypothetical protein [Marinilabiliales bacterium]